MVMAEVMLAVNLIVLTGPDQQRIEVNPDKVVTIRKPRGGEDGHFAPGTKCLIHTTDGKFFVVIEDCETVRRKLSLPR